MKFSTALIVLTSAVAFLASPTASESEVHLRVHLDKGICYTSCPSGQYCPNEEYPHKCRGPKSGECFNPATGAFQKGCSAGFKCNNGKCVYATSDPACLTEGCDGTREYCDSSIGECRAATNATECYNASIALFQDGCDAGYECVDDLCRVSVEPVDGRTCHIICSAGKYCENGSNKCRGPSYKGECFNLATGFFEDGCEDGFYCSFNKCVDVSLEDESGSLDDNTTDMLEDDSSNSDSIGGSSSPTTTTTNEAMRHNSLVAAISATLFSAILQLEEDD
ncbi:hypothetical protein AM587_10011601 [Phytophthora nicotianae]|uniref:Uncharacterized protein n=2 Tax=Phytophthora nicotianae TaxID=4792 RepID=A0A0W8BY49_PHYNI|nr:hypothetical protein AM587_10011601 [Phytophthora nicotianae]